MNWRNFIIAVVLGLSSTVAFAQSNLLNAKTPDQIGKKTEAELNADNDKPLPYGYVMDRDVLLGKRVWEIIDLDERVNFPLYYPVEGDIMETTDRQPLYNVLIKGIRDGKITEVYNSSYFTDKKTVEDIEGSLSNVTITNQGIDVIITEFGDYTYPEDFEDITDYIIYTYKNRKTDKDEVYNKVFRDYLDEYIVEEKIEAYHVNSYKIVGYWYFDKRQGELKYRLLGLCPVVPDVYTMGNEEKDYVELFWVYFPASRDILHEAKAFNNRNSAMPFSFDHMLNSRRFSAQIYAEENVHSDRLIRDYIQENAQMQLLESDRVKEKIRDFEQDMWNY